MENLPKEFLKRMRILLKDDYPLFLQSLSQPPILGLRVNTLFVSPSELLDLLPSALRPLPFCEEGFEVASPGFQPGKHPMHHAGAFYMQDPSAMTPAIVLDPQPGEAVLDLCAAPGGKSTQIAAKLKGDGVLVCNEVNAGRAAALISNLERLGVQNAIVYAQRPDQLCPKFAGYFDRVLVDAPCSGEGMMTKHSQAAEQWSAKHCAGCAARQKKILQSAACSVRLGGVLVYSTCTFSVEENEAVVADFLSANSDFSLEPIDLPFGSPSAPHYFEGVEHISYMRRIFPHQGGNGHFIARMRRSGDGRAVLKEVSRFERCAEFETFWQQTMEGPAPGVVRFANRLFIPPPVAPDVPGALRMGILAGEVRRGRFEPSHHLFKCKLPLRKDHRLDLLSFPGRTQDFLHGLEIPCNTKGYCGVRLAGAPLGFGKASNGRLKNHYPKGLRER